jgi:hypothetical protein
LAMPQADRHRSAENRFRRFFAVLGPGLISGAADDDPSSIGTYSVVGAQFGTAVLWTAFITWPLIAAIQMMCARIGLVTGTGLAHALGEKFPRPLVAAISLGLLVANTITVGADLSAMADASEMLSGLNSHYWCGLDDGFFPWDYYPYYAYDYYPYDYYPGYYADTEPYYYDEGVYSNTPMVDPTVTAVQTQLTQQGYYNGPVDGIFSPLTRDAVANYQIAKHLDVTGSLSAETLQSFGLPQPAAS